jgi:hypothetical protein|tara:strand:+ start:161 stop:331 length:171 start_codon:yes stop_codon:yes gene_type:complete
MDEQWQFNRIWEKMQKRVDDLERKVYWLEKFKQETEKKEYIRANKENILEKKQNKL